MKRIKLKDLIRENFADDQINVPKILTGRTIRKAEVTREGSLVLTLSDGVTFYVDGKRDGDLAFETARMVSGHGA
jgi:hypothetical protein